MSSRPNVVFIMSDQHRWDFMGYETNGVTYTPHLDQLGREGTILRGAYCTSPLCCPSRAAIASGQYAMNSGCYTNLHQLPPGTPTFMNQLRQAGYHTCVIGKTHMEIHAYSADFCSPGHLQFMDSLGWTEVHEADEMVREGIKCNYSRFLEEHGVLDDYIKFMENWVYFMEKTDRKSAQGPVEWSLPDELSLTAWVGRKATEWIKNYNNEQPFLLQVGFVDPHSPIKPLSRYMDLYRNQEESSPWNVPNTPAHCLDWRRGYRAMISHIDAWVGAIRQALQDAGLADNTIIVYTSDHGEMAGDQGAGGKTTFFEGSVRVPMIFAGPGIKSGQDSAALVETLDIGRTLCDLCDVPAHGRDQGKSLLPLLAGETTVHRKSVYSEMGCDRMLRTERYKLMWGEPRFDRRKLGRLHLDKPVNIPPSPIGLYDLQEDPHECHNLADSPAHRDLLMAMMSELLTRLNENALTQPFLSRGEYRPLRAGGDA